MSVCGLQAAHKYGEILPEFSTLSEAEAYFFSYRDDLLHRLEAVCTQYASFLPDYSMDSLKTVEKWYFELCDKAEFHKIGLTQEELESMLSIYFGAVVVKNNAEAEWLVMEYPFTPKKYEFLVRKGYCHIAIANSFLGLYHMENNKRRNLLFRKYNKYFGR